MLYNPDIGVEYVFSPYEATILSWRSFHLTLSLIYLTNLRRYIVRSNTTSSRIDHSIFKMRSQNTEFFTLPLVVLTSLLITVTNALPLDSRQTRVAQGPSIANQGENIWQKYSLEISIAVGKYPNFRQQPQTNEADPSVASLAIAGWLYWKHRKKKNLERIKARTAAAKEPTAAEIARAKEAAEMEMVGTGLLRKIFVRG
jgi:hypothetical protein